MVATLSRCELWVLLFGDDADAIDSSSPSPMADPSLLSEFNESRDDDRRLHGNEGRVRGECGSDFVSPTLAVVSSDRAFNDDAELFCRNPNCDVDGFKLGLRTRLLGGDREGRVCSLSAELELPSSDTLVDRGLGGRLESRDERLGGCGKDSMLTVFFSDCDCDCDCALVGAADGFGGDMG